MQLADELEAIEQDLSDLESQVAGGDLDEATAFRLRASYEINATGVRARLDQVAAHPDAGPLRRDRRRVLAGAAFVGVSLLVVGVSVGFAVRDRAPGGPITGDVVQRAAEEGLVRLEGPRCGERGGVPATTGGGRPLLRVIGGRRLRGTAQPVGPLLGS